MARLTVEVTGNALRSGDGADGWALMITGIEGNK